MTRSDRSRPSTSTASTIWSTAGPGQPQPGQSPPHLFHLDVTAVETVVHAAVATPVLRRQDAIDQGPHRTVGAQQRIGDLEQDIPAVAQGIKEVGPEPRQHAQGLDAARNLAHNHPHGLWCSILRPQQTHDHAKAAHCPQ
jgi:hypothetical protein